MSKTLSQFAFPSDFTSDNLKRLKELVNLGIEHRKQMGISKSIINADIRLLDKLSSIKRIKLNVKPEVIKENA